MNQLSMDTSLETTVWLIMTLFSNSLHDVMHLILRMAGLCFLLSLSLLYLAIATGVYWREGELHLYR